MKPSHQRKAAFAVAFFLVFGAAIGAAALFNNPNHYTSGVSLGPSDGMNVTLYEGGRGDLDDPFVDSDTVQLNTSNGNATVHWAGNADVGIANTNGTWTNLTHMDVSSNSVTVNPGDKPPVTVSGDADSFAWKQSMSLNDGTVDFVYAGTTGTTTATINQVPANTEIMAVDQSNTVLAVATSDGGGSITFTGMPNSEHNAELQTTSGGPSLSDPSPVGDQPDAPTQLSITVSDPDFPDDNVTVEFRLDGSVVATKYAKSDGEVTASVSNVARGDHNVTVTATDAYGQSTTEEWTFGVPETLYVRNASEPHGLIDDRQVTFTFTEGDDVFTATTSDGSLNLTDFPVEGDIVGTAEATNFTTRSFVIEDISEQQTVYMLHQSVSQVEVRFTLTDQTGDFVDNGAMLKIQRPINTSSGLQWQTVVADDFGVTGVTTSLEQGQKYRLIVKNDDNDMRVLGSYTAEVSETVPLEIGEVNVTGLSTESAWNYNASYLNTSSGNFVRFEFNDSATQTDQLWIEIHEFGNESNVLLANQSFSGPFGTFSLTEPVPSDKLDATWAIDVTLERNNRAIHFTAIAGPKSPILIGFPAWLMALISVGSLWIVGGLFSQLNGDIGGLVIAGMGAIYWYLDFLPQAIGQGVVVLALIMAGIVFINERRGEAGI